MLYVGNNSVSNKQTLYGWIDNREDLERVAEALNAEVNVLEEIKGISPRREYVAWWCEVPAPRWNNAADIRGASFIVGSWIDLQFDLKHTVSADREWAAAQKVYLLPTS